MTRPLLNCCISSVFLFVFLFLIQVTIVPSPKTPGLVFEFVDPLALLLNLPVLRVTLPQAPYPPFDYCKRRLLAYIIRPVLCLPTSCGEMRGAGPTAGIKSPRLELKFLQSVKIQSDQMMSCWWSRHPTTHYWPYGPLSLFPPSSLSPLIPSPSQFSLLCH